MSFWDDLTGSTAAAASKAAAADTYGKQQTAIGSLLGYGNDAKAGFDAIGDSYTPYVAAGNRLAGNTSDALNNLIQNPSSVSSLPGYQFDLQQGTQAADRSAAARGMDQSGRTLKDLTRFGTGLADNTYGSQLSRLMALNGQGFTQGMQAQGAQNQAYGTGLTDQFGARTSAYNGDMASAGTIGQGDVAAAGAQSAGAQNLLNAGLKIGGLGLGALSGGGALSSLMGGAQGTGNGMTDLPNNGTGIYTGPANQAGFGPTYARNSSYS